jgi:hypothetical protein
MSFKTTAFVLLIVIAASVCFSASCSPDKQPVSADNDGTIREEDLSADNTDTLEARKSVSDNLPADDFGGSPYIIVTDTYQEVFYHSAEINGDVINDAIYSRNAGIEERFNTDIDILAFPYPTAMDFMSKGVLSGEDSFTLCAMQSIMAGALVLNDLFINWLDIPHIDFGMPWWSNSTTEHLECYGTFAVGDLALGAMTNTYCMFYDKVQAENYNIGNLYPVISGGGWTIEKLSNIVKGVYADLNGNGEADIDDYYGLTTPMRSDVNAYLWSFDNPIFRRSASGEMNYVYKTEKLSNIIETLLDFCYNNPGVYAAASYSNPNETIQEMSRDLFRTGHSLFANGYIEMAVTHFRDIENEYGIIPYPKWDEAQAHYLTMADGNFAGLSIPKTVVDTQMAGIVTEGLCAETWKTVYPAYYDVALKVKFVRDAESVAMLDLIIDGRVFDFGYVYDNWKGVAFDLQHIIQSNNADFESYYAAKEAAVTKYYDEVTEYFMNA